MSEKVFAGNLYVLGSTVQITDRIPPPFIDIRKQSAKWILLYLLFLLSIFAISCKSEDQVKPVEKGFQVKQDEKASTISIYRKNVEKAIVTQHAEPSFRPYLHPITPPDGIGELTEYSPGHHKHQTGLYWGFTRVNGRDYFHHPDSGYWRRVSATVIQSEGDEVKWQTVYDLLDSAGNAILTESQNWSLKEDSGKFLMELEWTGEAKTAITIGKYDYGGLFLRMPWKEGINGEVVNAARQRNAAYLA